jgi:hypothetical protein
MSEIMSNDEIRAVYARAYDDADRGRHLAGLRAVEAAPQPSAEPSELVRAAKDAVSAMIDGMTPVEDGRPHHMVMQYKRALDALRRALALHEAKGGA